MDFITSHHLLHEIAFSHELPTILKTNIIRFPFSSSFPFYSISGPLAITGSSPSHLASAFISKRRRAKDNKDVTAIKQKAPKPKLRRQVKINCNKNKSKTKEIISKMVKWYKCVREQLTMCVNDDLLSWSKQVKTNKHTYKHSYQRTWRLEKLAMMKSPKTEEESVAYTGSTHPYTRLLLKMLS